MPDHQTVEYPEYLSNYWVETEKGNSLHFFFNRKTNLLCVDLIDAQERGGNEIVRMTLDEELLLEHLNDEHC